MTESLAVSRSELIERADSLERSERHKSELISMVSHEVRTPLASVLGFTRLLLERNLPEADRRRYLEIVDAEATRLAALVSDFLDARLIEEGRFSLRREPFDLRSLVREQAEVTLGHDESHELELELPDLPLRIDGDRARLAQVVGNVLSNAVKYSPDGGTITVGAAEDHGHARVWIADEGTGIPPGASRPALPAVLPWRRCSGRYPRHRARLGRVAPHCRGSRRTHRVRSARPRHALLVRPAARSRGQRPPVSRLRSAGVLGGAALLLAGVLGFVPGVTAHYGDLRFAHGSRAELFGVFRVSIALNLVHVTLGVVGIAAVVKSRVIALASLALWLLGVAAAGSWLSLDLADNWLHLVLAVVLLGLPLLVGGEDLADDLERNLGGRLSAEV